MARLWMFGCVAVLSSCAAITTSPSWVGGDMSVTGPLPRVDEAEMDVDLEDAPLGKGTIAARHILVMHKESKSRPDHVTRTKGEARARAEECLKKLRAGANFSELVGQYSDEPGAIERSGDLGTFRRDTMVKPFADAAFKLDVGKMSGVVETSYGFHIIKRTR